MPKPLRWQEGTEVVKNPSPVYRTIKSENGAGPCPQARRRRVFRHLPGACDRKPAWRAGRNHWTSAARSGSIGATALTHREADEEARPCHSPDFVACMGTNQTGAEERDRARRQLCAHRPHRRWQAGLFDEVRKFAGAGCTAATAGRGSATACSATGSAPLRHFRLVPRSDAAGRIDAFRASISEAERKALARTRAPNLSLLAAAKHPRIRSLSATVGRKTVTSPYRRLMGTGDFFQGILHKGT